MSEDKLYYTADKIRTCTAVIAEGIRNVAHTLENASNT